jgi:hypothetical protein
MWNRTGNIVTIWGYMSNLATNSTSSAAFTLSGVPYEVAESQVIGACMVDRVNLPATTTYLTADNKIYFYQSTSTSWTGLKIAAINTGGNIGTVFFSGTYITDDTTFVPVNGATIS